MRFLEAGIDPAVIALWLGHETIATTSIYLHADMNLKRAALDRTRQPDTPAGDYRPDDGTPGDICAGRWARYEQNLEAGIESGDES